MVKAVVFKLLDAVDDGLVGLLLHRNQELAQANIEAFRFLKGFGEKMGGNTAVLKDFKKRLCSRTHGNHPFLSAAIKADIKIRAVITINNESL